MCSVANRGIELAERGNPAEIAEEMGHSLEVPFNPSAHIIADLKGRGPSRPRI